jgi:hypothetical protein
VKDTVDHLDLVARKADNALDVVGAGSDGRLKTATSPSAGAVPNVRPSIGSKPKGTL